MLVLHQKRRVIRQGRIRRRDLPRRDHLQWIMLVSLWYILNPKIRATSPKGEENPLRPDLSRWDMPVTKSTRPNQQSPMCMTQARSQKEANHRPDLPQRVTPVMDRPRLQRKTRPSYKTLMIKSQKRKTDLRGRPSR